MFSVFSESKRIRDIVKPHINGDLPLTIYQDRPEEHINKIMLIFMNPSKGNGIMDEVDECARDGFINWLQQKRFFFHRFIETLKKHITGSYHFKRVDFDDITLDSFDNYVKLNFFEDFYVTDFVKLRLNTSEMRESLKLKTIKTRWSGLLQEEIRLVSPPLTMSFGANAWESLRKLVQPELDKIPVTKVHGNLYNITGDVHYIPLAFIPGASSYLKDSYFMYLNEGLREQIKHMRD